MEARLTKLVDACLSLSFDVDKLLDGNADLFFSLKLYPDLKQRVTALNHSCFSALSDLLRYRTKEPVFQAQDDLLQDDFAAKGVTDLLDDQLERIDSILDGCRLPIGKEATSVKVRPVVARVTVPVEYGKRKAYSIIHALNITRPQLAFLDKPDNSAIPTVPKLSLPKPNCSCTEEFKLQIGVHPYQWELENLSYPDWVYQQEDEIIFHPIADTPLTVVESEQELDLFIERMSAEQVISVDLEHHNYRSFEGFVCLMQVSTRTEDFIIDTLACRSFMYKLNGLFTNPRVLKVFHGAESDVIWLQRDFGIYVVGMFDTFYASKLLSLGAHSLSHLVRHYGGIELDKKFQLADWRIRPIPQEMLDYARGDTHYLLYIWDRMRNDLLRQGKRGTSFLKQVLTSSTQRCLQLYVKQSHNESEWKGMVNKYNKQLNNRQVAVIKGILQWRDTVARMEDESLHYVMPKAMVMRIAESLPDSVSGLTRCFVPCPPLVKQHAHDLLLVIRNRLSESELLAQGEIQTPNDIGPTHIKFEENVEAINSHDMAVSDDNTNVFYDVDNAPEAMVTSIDSVQALSKEDGVAMEIEQSESIHFPSETTNSLKTLSISVTTRPKKLSVFDDEDENVSDNLVPFILPLLTSSIAQSSIQELTVDREPENNSSGPVINGKPTKKRKPKKKKTPAKLVSLINNPNSPQLVDAEFISSLTKPKASSMPKSNPTALISPVDLSKEYQDSLNQAKSATKPVDFDPNDNSTVVIHKQASQKAAPKRKKFSSRSQKRSTFTVSK